MNTTPSGLEIDDTMTDRNTQYREPGPRPEQILVVDDD